MTVHTLQVYYLNDEENGGKKAVSQSILSSTLALIISVRTITNLTSICSSSLQESSLEVRCTNPGMEMFQERQDSSHLTHTMLMACAAFQRCCLLEF